MPTSGALDFPANEKNDCMKRPQLRPFIDELTNPRAGPAVHWSVVSPDAPVGSVPAIPTPQRPHGWSSTMRSKRVVSTHPPPLGPEV